MAAEVAGPTRAEAIRILDDGFHSVAALLSGVPEQLVTERGTIGGGEWSAKDLLAHLTFWERNGVEALEAWSRDETAPADRMLREPGLNAINAAAVEASFALSWPQVREDADDVHAALLRAIQALTDARWVQPATSRGKRSLGVRLGTLLIGAQDDLFDHVAAHMASLRAWRNHIDGEAGGTEER